MSEQKDLTRWNRAGLNRFRYVNGNAVEYLEVLRQQLVIKFQHQETGLCEWINPAEEIPENEKLPESEIENVNTTTATLESYTEACTGNLSSGSS